MLNKNQSKKWNSWKYALVLPALTAFMFLFQIEVIAQEKTSQKQENKKEKKATEVVITKNTTDQEIKEQCEKLKKLHNIDLIFSNIKRNSKGEIININSSFNDNKGSHGESNIFKTTSIIPIPSFRFFSHNGEIGFENIVNSKKSEEVVNKNIITKGDTLHLATHQTIITDTIYFDKDKSISDTQIFIDDKKSDRAEMDKLDPKEISSVAVTKKNNKQEIQIITNNYTKIANRNNSIPPPPPPRVSKVKIAPPPPPTAKKSTHIALPPPLPPTVKNTTDSYQSNSSSEEKKEIKQGKELNGWKVSAIPATQNMIEMIQNDKNIDSKKAIIIIDGKLSNMQTLEKLNPKEITRVLNHKIIDGTQKQKDEAIRAYGEKALNGIIEIETKGFSKE